VTICQLRKRGEDLELGFSGSRWHDQLGHIPATIAMLCDVATYAVPDELGKAGRFWLAVSAP
jgi:hypothetical protein